MKYSFVTKKPNAKYNGTKNNILPGIVGARLAKNHSYTSHFMSAKTA
ncbi:hypothetical protein H6F71_12000 [Microcoleus sp. FACHB-61]|nr:hypothetical protein [Microcoleus sp. FACHB-61]